MAPVESIKTYELEAVITESEYAALVEAVPYLRGEGTDIPANLQMSFEHAAGFNRGHVVRRGYIFVKQVLQNYPKFKQIVYSTRRTKLPTKQNEALALALSGSYLSLKSINYTESEKNNYSLARVDDTLLTWLVYPLYKHCIRRFGIHGIPGDKLTDADIDKIFGLVKNVAFKTVVKYYRGKKNNDQKRFYDNHLLQKDQNGGNIANGHFFPWIMVLDHMVGSLHETPRPVVPYPIFGAESGMGNDGVMQFEGVKIEDQTYNLEPEQQQAWLNQSATRWCDGCEPKILIVKDHPVPKPPSFVQNLKIQVYDTDTSPHKFDINMIVHKKSDDAPAAKLKNHDDTDSSPIVDRKLSYRILRRIKSDWLLEPVKNSGDGKSVAALPAGSTEVSSTVSEDDLEHYTVCVPPCDYSTFDSTLPKNVNPIWKEVPFKACVQVIMDGQFFGETGMLEGYFFKNGRGMCRVRLDSSLHVEYFDACHLSYEEVFFSAQNRHDEVVRTPTAEKVQVPPGGAMTFLPYLGDCVTTSNSAHNGGFISGFNVSKGSIEVDVGPLAGTAAHNIAGKHNIHSILNLDRILTQAEHGEMMYDKKQATEARKNLTKKRKADMTAAAVVNMNATAKRKSRSSTGNKTDGKAAANPKKQQSKAPAKPKKQQSKRRNTT